MLVYEDIFTGDELFSDSFPYKELFEGVLWEVEGKCVDADIGANPSAEGEEDETKKVYDIVHAFRLQATSFDKKEFVTFVKRYIENITPKLDGEKQEIFKKNIEPATEFLLSKLGDFQFFVGEGMHVDSIPVLAYYKDGAIDPTFLYFAHGLKEIAED